MYAAGPCTSYITSDLSHVTITLDQTEFEGEGPFPLTFRVSPASTEDLYLCSLDFYAPYLLVTGVESDQGSANYSYSLPKYAIYHTDLNTPIHMDHEVTFTIFVKTSDKYQELQSRVSFGLDLRFTPTCSGSTSDSFEQFNTVARFTRESKGCLTFSIDLSSYFWNVGEEGTIRYSTVNHCSRVVGSSELDGLALVVHSGVTTPFQGVQDTNATHWQIEEAFYLLAYFDPLQPGEEAWVTTRVKSAWGGPSDVRPYSFPTLRWYENRSLYDGMSRRGYSVTSHCICNENDDGKREQDQSLFPSGKEVLP